MTKSNRILTKIGHSVLIRFDRFSDILFMILIAIRDLLPWVKKGGVATRSVLFRQIYFTGWQASGIVISTAILLGIVIMVQIASVVGQNAGLTGKILVWVIMRELAPLLTAIVIIARSGTAIAAELGNMKLSGELESLKMMGIQTEDYLIYPRIAAVTASTLILTVYSLIFSFIACFLSASIGWHIPFEQFNQGVISAIGLREIIIFFCKSTIFGLVISAICCSFGLSIKQSSTEIPQVATKAVMTSLFALFFLDGIITYIGSLVV